MPNTPPSRHILGNFDEALASLRSNVLMMAGLTERAFDRAIRGLIDRDDDLCVHAIADDEEIDQLEKQIDKDGIDLLLRYQPVASDLRRVVSAMKLSPNIERVGDQATTVARRARKLNQQPALAEVEWIEPLYALAMSMFKDAIDAYTREDVEQAMSIIPRDEELDEMNATLQKQLIERMEQNADQLRGYLNLVFIARCLERVGDHASNIAEDAVYAAAAEDIRHQLQSAS